MSSKVIPTTFVSVKKVVLELEADSTSLVALRVKPDRRQSHLDMPVARERRDARQSSVRKKARLELTGGLRQKNPGSDLLSHTPTARHYFRRMKLPITSMSSPVP